MMKLFSRYPFILQAKYGIFFLFLAIAGCSDNQTPNEVNEGKPNVIIIFTDDQGTYDTNLYGSEDLYTPNMDSLARSGVRFTQFYAGAPVCSPSRAALLTGMVPQKAGLAGNAASLPSSERGLPSKATTLAEIMQSSGYNTGHVGKWHLGYQDGMLPNDQGFDHSFGHMGGCIDNYSHFYYWNPPNTHDLWRNGEEVWYDGEFFPDLMVKEASKFIENNKDQPFFLYFALNTPHYPLQGTGKWRKYYEDLESPRDKYAAFVSTTDEKIGALLDHLEKSGQANNTIVVFQSDHGHSKEARTFGGGGNAGDLRGSKFSLFEGGIRIPAFISYPGTIPENEVRNQMAIGTDWFPTIADYCGLDTAGLSLDGKSLKKVIENNADSPHETLHWMTPIHDQWVVRQGPWKLIGNPWQRDEEARKSLAPSDSLFLANLDKDETEQTNFAGEFPGKLESLHKLHKQWVKKVENFNN